MKDEIKQKTSPRNFFPHLLSIVTLYASAISLLTVLFQYINLLLPDALEQYYNFQLYQGRLRVALSVLVVVFPVYIWSMWYLKKLYIRIPSEKNLRVRRWLIYFTLFITAIIIMIDLISLINGFMQGELTLRFALKVLAVLLVASSIFEFYLMDIKKTQDEV